MVEDRAYQRALERRRRLEAQLKEVDLFLAMYRQFVDEVEKVVDETADEVATTLAAEEVRPNFRRHAAKAVKKKTVGISQAEFAGKARMLLLEHGKPASRREMLAIFQKKGIRVGGEDELVNIGTKLWRARNVIAHFPESGYWPKDVAHPDGRYDPSNKPQGPTAITTSTSLRRSTESSETGLTDYSGGLLGITLK
jgi:hypothetical protein